MIVCKMPDPIQWALQNRFRVASGECFTNCGLATILTLTESGYSDVLASSGYTINYILGTLTPPGYETVGHAWLKATRGSMSEIWDPTLQVNSQLWNAGQSKFNYVAVREFSAEQLVQWFRERYPNNRLTSELVPEGRCRFPIIDKNRTVK